MTTLLELLPYIQLEMEFAINKYGKYHNSHEHYAVLKEEVEEWWEAVRGNTSELQMYELLQVSAVALRYIIERGEALDIAESQRQRHERG